MTRKKDQKPSAETRPAARDSAAVERTAPEAPGGVSAPGATDAAAAQKAPGETPPAAPNQAAAGGADASPDTGEPAPTAEALLEQVESLQLQAQEHRDQALRFSAELENTRKRADRKIEEAHKYALEEFTRELLPVLDSMQLGLDAASAAENLDSLREGMTLTLKMLTDCLQKNGVTAHDPVGERFDPQWHEAVSMLEQEGADSGQIVSVMQKGYELNGRLIRPAMVVVAK